MAAFQKYNKFVRNILAGVAPIDFDTDTIKVALMTSSYIPNAATHTWWSDVSANEISGTGYTAGGQTLTSVTVTESSGVATVDCANPSWAQNASGFTNARYCIFYKSTGTASTSPLIGYVDLGSNQGIVSGSLTLTIDATGLIQFA